MPTREEIQESLEAALGPDGMEAWSEIELIGSGLRRNEMNLRELIQSLERHVEVPPNAVPFQWAVPRHRKFASAHHGGPAIRMDEFRRAREYHHDWVCTIKNAGLPPIKPASQVTPKFNPV